MTNHCGLPELALNADGLRAAELRTMFLSEPEVSPQKRKWRRWLVHCLIKASRHYKAARTLIEADVAEQLRPAAALAEGRLLYVLDFGLEMEDCITSLEKISQCLRTLSLRGDVTAVNLLALADQTRMLNAFRRQQEHMHEHLAAGQTGDGPIILAISEDGDHLKLRKLKMPLTAIHQIIQAAYLDVAALVPGFDPESRQTQYHGPVNISVSSEMTVVVGGPASN